MNFLHDKFEKLNLYQAVQAVYIHGRSIYIYAILFSPTLFKKKLNIHIGVKKLSHR